ncbi:MAG: tRNA (5-methylaminomethyl-2-thiouridine)(34)-methyltransferase MnmD [Bacteroidetes bacterium]|nr:tRNA (5-methylaminomethyl-2-thiouridine)(34)-methyltransferase MnmD [Bacteroidota bacterium]
MNTRKIIVTQDGSHTISIPELNITFHSRFGAIQESKHVFIHAGLEYFFNENKIINESSIHIFEIGFGTGLNALLSLQFANEKKQHIQYETLEPFPLSPEEFLQLNYTGLLNENLNESFTTLHLCEYEEKVLISDFFALKKIKTYLQDFTSIQQFHIIYFDTFDPNTQPELWTETILKKMYDILLPFGILVTYCSKGSVRRAMQSVGFNVEKLKGPSGKREIVRAEKKFQA